LLLLEALELLERLELLLLFVAAVALPTAKTKAQMTPVAMV